MSELAGAYATIAVRSPRGSQDGALYWNTARMLAQASQTRARVSRRRESSDPTLGMLSLTSLVFMHGARHDGTLQMTELMMQLAMLARLVSLAQEAAQDRRHAAQLRAAGERRTAREMPVPDPASAGLDSATLRGIRAAQSTMLAPPNNAPPTRLATTDRQQPWRQPGRDDHGRGTTDE